MRSLGFVDFVRIHVKAGDGGDGMIGFRREKYVPEGGPAGGHGGEGGSIYLEGNPDLVTLLDFKMRPFIKAQRGANGQNFNKAGKGGEDVTVQVPLGTTVVDADTGEELGEVTKAGQRLLVAKGGWGGRGNESFASATHRTPMRAEEGRPGVERNLILELKSIADIGLVGLPNAGKSTLLAHITNAHPKIANYPFTTIHPNLGVMTDDTMSRALTVADIPGLIEGAHHGAGLGDRFLRHIERTKVLVHIVSPEEGTTDITDPEELDILAEDLLEAYRLVRAELDQYSTALNQKPSVVVLNKTDLMPEGAPERILAAFRRAGIEALEISAETGNGLDTLRTRLFQELDRLAEEERAAAAALAEVNEFDKADGPSSERDIDGDTDGPGEGDSVMGVTDSAAPSHSSHESHRSLSSLPASDGASDSECDLEGEENEGSSDPSHSIETDPHR